MSQISLWLRAEELMQASKRVERGTTSRHFVNQACKNLWRSAAIPFLMLLGLGDVVSRAQNAVTSVSEPNQELLRAARAGDAGAQLELGKFYHLGKGGRRNDVEAAKWLGAAAQARSAEASAWLGSMYLDGRGVMRDQVRGAALIEDAAAQNNPVGLRFAGVMHETGEGASRNYSQAAAFYARAVAQKDANAYDRLGLLFLRGLGVSRNPEKAFELLSQGAALGDQWAELNLGEFYQHGRVPKGKLPALPPSLGRQSGKQLVNARRKQNLSITLKLFSDSAAQGNRVAAFKAGRMYEHGAGTVRDLDKAFAFYEQSASHRYVLAQLALGRAHELGLGTSVNPLHAYVAYSLASEQGNQLAARRLESLIAKLSPEDLATAQSKLKQLKQIEATLSKN